MGKTTAGILFAALICAAPAFAQEGTKEPTDTLKSETLRSYEVPEANQAVGVDDTYFYAIDNRTIAKYEKATGKRVAVQSGEKGGPLKHLDSAAVVDGKIYTAHSNYPEWPMTSSVEVWDAATLKHLETHSLGIDRGSLTWLDQHDGVWYGAFANYNRVFDRSPNAYGNKYTTQVVRFDPGWTVAEAWILPDALLEKFEDMSNSGGSWGPDGKLWLSGHDPAEIYRMEFPEVGSILKWAATAPADIAGQGIAWDHSDPGVIYGIVRKDRRVTATRVELPKKAAANQ
ncbi:cycloisomerase [Propylenella binzhouense]|uniref:Cycloisomerase n=1 Tax=Propylenella binzhouense TaxID=2555902 RepID=A0A964T3A7_9HYPH|nr:cycloisomerase [Propylenella binzhouense]MYZ47711.1 cycloisomerase [Propylenella binzhouense]